VLHKKDGAVNTVHFVLQLLICEAQFETVAKVEVEPIAPPSQSQLGHERLQLGFALISVTLLPG